MFAPPMAKAKAKSESATVPNRAAKTGYRIPGRPAGSLAEQIRTLQGRIGNQATQRLLAQRSSGSSRTWPGDQHAQAGPALDRRKEVDEQQAERVAERVMRMPEPRLQHAWPGSPTDEPGEPLQAGGTGRTATPPVVREALRSPGQPLEPATRDFMEQRFGQDFGGIRIHTDAPAARAATALGAEAFTVGRHIAFARERFAPGTTQGKRLMAHELTHSMQQAATSPYVALRPERKSAAPVSGSSKFDGVLLGTGPNKEEVRVKREVGGTRGYDDRLQAIAVARLAKAEPSAVILGKDGKWHALETTAELAVVAAGGNPPFLGGHGLPSLTGIGPSRQRVDELKAKWTRLGRLEAERRDDPEFRKAVPGQQVSQTIEEERQRTLQLLNQATETSAALTLGVPESEILLTRSLSGRVASKINIIGTPGQDSPGGGHNPLGGETTFEEGRASAVHLDLPELDEPARAQTVLFHEVQHLTDWQLAQHWVMKYTTETGRLFVKGAPGRKPFKNWLDAQVKGGRLSKAEAELVFMQTADQSAYTEARANVREFLAALQAGAPDVATRSLVGYAHSLKPKKEGGGGRYASPAAGSEVQAALVRELKAAYGEMPRDMKQQYDAAVAAAKNEYPGAWLSELDFSKQARR